MAIYKLEHVGIMCTNLEKSLAFYTEVLGMVHQGTLPHTNGVIKLAFLTFPGNEETQVELIEGYKGDLPAEGRTHHIALTVDNLDEELARIKEHGVTLWDEAITTLPNGARYFFFTGPDGELLELFEPSSKLQPYPLQFEPEFKERIWGGRALEGFGLTPPPGAIGEGWMIGDHPNGTTKVINGVLAGKGLDEIRSLYGKELFGKKGFSEKNGRFPLLIKLLDCNDDLSIQVHPTDHYAGLPAGELGKTEMWYILGAAPDAKIIYGMKEGTTRESLAAAIEEGRIMDCLQEVPVKAGDAFYIPAGTVHALCSGVVVAEIQQNSDTTYRLFDYNRPGLDGQLRELHIEDSLNVIAYEGAGATRMATDAAVPGQWLEIARSPYFVVEKGIVNSTWDVAAAEESFTIIVIAEGSGTIRWADGSLDAKAGQCFLLPANLGTSTLDGQMTVLRSYAP